MRYAAAPTLATRFLTVAAMRLTVTTAARLCGGHHHHHHQWHHHPNRLVSLAFTPGARPPVSGINSALRLPTEGRLPVSGIRADLRRRSGSLPPSSAVTHTPGAAGAGWRVRMMSSIDYKSTGWPDHNDHHQVADLLNFGE